MVKIIASLVAVTPPVLLILVYVSILSKRNTGKVNYCRTHISMSIHMDISLFFSHFVANNHPCDLQNVSSYSIYHFWHDLVFHSF